MTTAMPTKRPGPFDLGVDYGSDSDSDDGVRKQDTITEELPPTHPLAQLQAELSNEKSQVAEAHPHQNTLQHQEQSVIVSLNDPGQSSGAHQQEPVSVQEIQHDDIDSLFEEAETQNDMTEDLKDDPPDGLGSQVQQSERQAEVQDAVEENLGSQSHFDGAQSQDHVADQKALELNTLSPRLEGQATFAHLESGFSDEEGEDHEAWDRNFQSKEAKRTSKSKSPKSNSPTSKKSPRREDDEADVVPKAKKSRPTIFGTADEFNEDTGNGRGVGSSEKNVKSVPTMHHNSPMSLDDLLTDTCEGLNLNSLDTPGDGWDEVEKDPHLGLFSPVQETENRFDRIISGQAPQYELRKNIDRYNHTTYLDNDQTGDYDPEAEGKRLREQKKAKAKAKSSSKKKEKQVKKDKLIVRLKFTIIGNVLNITDGKDKWPKDHSVIDSDEEREALERKAEKRSQTYFPPLNWEGQEPIPDPYPKSEIDDLTGYPIARSCHTCRADGDRCSMVDGGTFPCEQCSDPENPRECNLLMPARIKGRCYRCRELPDVECSFENPDIEPHDTCQQCEADECFGCTPAPPDGYRHRIADLDKILYANNRKQIACTRCRMIGKKCSLTKKNPKPPCSLCEKEQVGCTFYDLPGMKKAKKKKGKQKATEEEIRKQMEEGEPSIPRDSIWTEAELEGIDEASRPPRARELTPEFKMEDTEGRSGVVIKIRTSFAHPMVFNSPTQNGADCNFCEMPTFGFIGHFERQVHVLKWNNGLGYGELAGGHRDGNGPTTMCEDCTIARVQIMYCPGHDIQPMIAPEETPDFDELAGEIMSTDPRTPEMADQLQRWCSLCFSAASFKCTRIQPPLMGDENHIIDGCGLRLCTKCEQELRGPFVNDLQLLVEFLEKEPKLTEKEAQKALNGAVRADVGLLSKEGILMRNVEDQTTGGVEEDPMDEDE